MAEYDASRAPHRLWVCPQGDAWVEALAIVEPDGLQPLKHAQQFIMAHAVRHEVRIIRFDDA
jgi:hypothetical protein